jgi:hypothetical protein
MIDLTSRREEEFPVPAQKLWETVADFGAIDAWWPEGMLEKIEVEGEGVGMVRSIYTTVGIVLHEKLESIDHEARVLELSIVGDLPAGMQEYYATGSVRAGKDGSCVLTWEGRYKVSDASAEQGARGFIEGAYGAMFGGLREFVTKEV